MASHTNFLFHFIYVGLLGQTQTQPVITVMKAVKQ